jgi:hypothetical protein
VTRYNDIMAVELDHATYSSQLGGNIVIEDFRAEMEHRGFIRMAIRRDARRSLWWRHPTTSRATRSP